MLRRQTSALPGGSPPSLDSLQRNVERLSVLTRNLVDAANLQSSELLLHKDPCDLQSLVQWVAKGVAAKAADKGVSLKVVGQAAVVVAGDGARLETVIQHLLDNALKFTPKNGLVTIEVRATGARAQVAVTDTGVGMTATQLGEIFRPFVQVHDTMQVSDAGAGLGLYIAQGIVRLHGGEISAASPGLGQGSTFLIGLPLSAPSTAAGALPSLDK